MNNIAVGQYPATSGLSQALNQHLKPQIARYFEYTSLFASTHEPSPLQIVKGAFEQASLGAQLWETIKGVNGECTASIRSCAQHYGEQFDLQIKKMTKLMDGVIGDMWKSDIRSLRPLLLTDMERLKFSLGLICNGRMEGDTRSHIAEGAALLYLNSVLTQMAFVAMSVRNTCTGRLSNLLQNNNACDLSSYRKDICYAAALLGGIHQITKCIIRPALLFEDTFLSRESLAVINSAMHMLNNRFTPLSGYHALLAEIMENTGRTLTPHVRGDLIEMLGEYNALPNGLVHSLVSDDEPIVFVGRQFYGANLFRKGAIPVGIDSKKINIMVGHFVHNAVTHPQPGRELTVRILQTPHGIFVVDNGHGISPDRLGEIGRHARAGLAVKTDHELGTGQGLRDSVLLLKDLFNGLRVAGDSAITIESRKGYGTVSSIMWGDDPNHVHPEIMPTGWHRIQFTSNSGRAWRETGFSKRPSSETRFSRRPSSNVFSATRRRAVITRPVLNRIALHDESFNND